MGVTRRVSDCEELVGSYHR